MQDKSEKKITVEKGNTGDISQVNWMQVKKPLWAGLTNSRKAWKLLAGGGQRQPKELPLQGHQTSGWAVLQPVFGDLPTAQKPACNASGSRFQFGRAKVRPSVDWPWEWERGAACSEARRLPGPSLRASSSQRTQVKPPPRACPLCRRMEKELGQRKRNCPLTKHLQQLRTALAWNFVQNGI